MRRSDPVPSSVRRSLQMQQRRVDAAEALLAARRASLASSLAIAQRDGCSLRALADVINVSHRHVANLIESTRPER